MQGKYDPYSRMLFFYRMFWHDALALGELWSISGTRGTENQSHRSVRTNRSKFNELQDLFGQPNTIPVLTWHSNASWALASASASALSFVCAVDAAVDSAVAAAVDIVGAGAGADKVC